MGTIDLLAGSEKAREDGNFLEALKLADEALIACQEDGDNAKFAQTLCSRALIFRHLFEDTGNKNYAKLAKFEAKAAVKILEMNDEKKDLSNAYYTFAKCLETLEKFDKEKEAIVEALKNETENQGFISEMHTRLAALEYRLGDGSALARFNTAYDELLNSELETYVKDVWTSGARLHMASAMIAREEFVLAKEQLDAAREIIEANSDLKLRAGQLAKLQESIS